MAVRWKAGQRRKRWTEQAISLPADVLSRIQEADASVELSSNASFATFSKQLLSFGELPSTFAQIAATKALSDSLLSVLKSGPASAQTALRLYVELFIFAQLSTPSPWSADTPFTFIEGLGIESSRRTQMLLSGVWPGRNQAPTVFYSRSCIVYLHSSSTGNIERSPRDLFKHFHFVILLRCSLGARLLQ